MGLVAAIACWSGLTRFWRYMLKKKQRIRKGHFSTSRLRPLGGRQSSSTRTLNRLLLRGTPIQMRHPDVFWPTAL